MSLAIELSADDVAKLRIGLTMLRATWVRVAIDPDQVDDHRKATRIIDEIDALHDRLVGQ